MKKILNFRANPIYTTFIILTSITILFVIVSAILKLVPNMGYSEKAPMKLDSGWQYKFDISQKNTYEVSLKTLKTLNDSKWNNFPITGMGIKISKPYNTMWLKIKLPNSKSWPNQSIFFEEVLSENFEVYSDSKLIFKYITKVPHSLSFFSTTRNRFIVPLGEDLSGKTLYLRSYSGFDHIGPYKNILLGSQNDLERIMIKKDYDNIILGFFFIILGIFMFPNIVFLDKHNRKMLITLCLFILSFGLFLISVPTAIKLIILDNGGLWTAINAASTQFIMIFFMYFFEQIFLKRYNMVFQRIWRFNIYLFVILLILNFSALIFKIFDLNISMSIFYIFTGIDLSILIFLVIKNALSGDIDARIFTVGFAVFAFIAVIEIILLVISNTKPIMYKWGILILVASFILILGRRFSDTHQRLLIYSKELEDLNKTLEQRVSDRTRELKESMETLVKTQEQLIQSEKMAALGSLVVGIAHEINTPLGVGITATSHLKKETIEIMDLYKESKMKKNDFESYLEICGDTSSIILSNLNRAAELITSFKKVAVDQSIEEKRSFNIKQYIEDILLSLSIEIRKSKHKITLICPDELEINSYPGAFSQVVTNLIMNSIIHAYDDEEKGNIIIHISENNDNNIELKFSDDGKGIDKKSLGKIFEPFYTTRRNKGGTGLGLNIVYNIVTQKLKGTIMCESEERKGTTFVINFPK